MQQVNIYEAKSHLSQLVDRASKGDAFIIAKAGRPLVKVVPYREDIKRRSRIGGMRGRLNVPDDIKAVAADEVLALFEGSQP
jgi:prevent-host-death family protein